MSQKADKRKQQATELQATITEQVENLASSEAWQEFLDFSAKFHSYSLNNVLLLLGQNRWVTRVAGYRKWQELGRQVRKGEKSLKIFGYASKVIQEKDKAAGLEEVRKAYYPTLSVFDISQTEPIPGADPIPEVATQLQGDDPAGIQAATRSYLESLGWTVTIETLRGPNGYTMTDGSKKIVLADGLSEAQAAKTLLHEAAHALLHADTEDTRENGRQLREIEAESTAYIVAGALGIDSSPYSIGYLAGWSDLDTELIKSTARNVIDCAHKIIDGINDNVTHITSLAA